MRYKEDEKYLILKVEDTLIYKRVVYGVKSDLKEFNVFNYYNNGQAYLFDTCPALLTNEFQKTLKQINSSVIDFLVNYNFNCYLAVKVMNKIKDLLIRKYIDYNILIYIKGSEHSQFLKKYLINNKKTLNVAVRRLGR